ncbi:MAG: MFS transporter [Actinomycetota bacterium]
MSSTGALAPFRERNFRLFYAGQLVSMIGTWLQFVAEGWLVFRLTGSPAWLGIVAGAGAAPGLLLTLLGGQVADRYPKRAILLVTQALSMLLALLLAVLAYGRVPTFGGWLPIHLEPWHVAAVAAALGAVNAFSGPAFQSFLPTLVPREQMGSAIALNSLLWNSSRVLGPLAAGSLIAGFGAAGCFLLNALSYVAVIGALLMMRVEERVNRSGPMPSALEGLRYVGRTPVALRVMILFGATASFGWLYQTLLPALASEQFHRGALAVGQLTAAAGVGSLVAAFVTAGFSREPVRRILIYGGSVTSSLALLVFSFARSYPVGLGALVVAGFGLILCGVNINARLQEEVPDELRGRVMAVFSLIWMGFQPLGGLLGGAFAERMGSAWAVGLGAGVCLITALGLFAWSQSERRALRQQGADPDRRAPDAPRLAAGAQEHS